MKKDMFNGKVKKEYVSHLITSYIAISVLFLPITYFIGWCHIHAPIEGKIVTGIVLLCCIYGIVINPLLTLFVIRRYPKYPKIRRLLLNSDYYFVGNDKRESAGDKRSRAAFDAITKIIDKEIKK